ncbi:uncharacterized protein TNIN_15921 [Trichonephila inaurata madagascariensis]|uniref:Uncharacterized protein n=1 Tax=Trichonephila inaurata madagascariensis TaxID=2747483 RepID=A0A8X7BSR2_9ARAC|nr:uncharacterized protein TNIN_15921 [Trichonephila inaurata madagascariensis]
MTDILNKNIRALKLLGFERNNLSDLLLLNIILKKIDRETRKQFEQSIDSHQIPELDTFIMFLEKRSQTIDSINRSAPIIHKQKQVTFNKSKIFLNSNDSSNSCAICKLPHLIHKCSAYQNMKVSDRFHEIKRLNLCINCLKEHHKIKECKSKNSCSVCKKRHHTSLHIFEAIPSPLPSTLANELEPPPDMQGSTPPEHSYTFSNSVGEKKSILLPTAMVYLRGQMLKNGTTLAYPSSYVQNIHVPRLVIGKGRIIIHGFADASTAAYGATICSIDLRMYLQDSLCSKIPINRTWPFIFLERRDVRYSSIKNFSRFVFWLLWADIPQYDKWSIGSEESAQEPTIDTRLGAISPSGVVSQSWMNLSIEINAKYAAWSSKGA